jgi:hypothetical protein
MEVLSKLYKSKRIANISDGVGGVAWNTYWYNYLYFDSQTFYMFSSIEKVRKSIKYPIQEFDDSRTIKNYKVLLNEARKGEYKMSKDGKIEFLLPIQVVNNSGNFDEVNRIYSAFFENEGRILKLKAFNENVPSEIVIDEEFEKIEQDLLWESNT